MIFMKIYIWKTKKTKTVRSAIFKKSKTLHNSRSHEFLLPMNEVNVKYWFSDLKKNFFIDFLDELGLFIEEKPIFTKKKFPSLCRRRDFMAFHMKILSARFLKDAFKLETSPFGSLEELV
jgi:hypothetical protein